VNDIYGNANTAGQIFDTSLRNTERHGVTQDYSIFFFVSQQSYAVEKLFPLQGIEVYKGMGYTSTNS